MCFYKAPYFSGNPPSFGVLRGRVLPAEQLGVWQDVLQPVVVQHAEGEYRRSGVVGKVSGDAGWKRQHHLPGDLHDAPAGPNTEIEAGRKKMGGLKMQQEGFVHARDGVVTAPASHPLHLGVNLLWF